MKMRKFENAKKNKEEKYSYNRKWRKLNHKIPDQAQAQDFAEDRNKHSQ